MSLLQRTILKLCRNAHPELAGARTLFTADSLGIDRFTEQRERSAIQYSGGAMVEKFKSRVRDSLASETQALYSDDFKSFLHLASGTQEDVDAVVKFCSRYQSQNGVRFGKFTIGPVIMRYFHLFGKPAEALQAFTDPANEGLFHQFSSFKVLMDLLFEHGMYNELLGVFDIVKELKIGGYSYHANCTTLAVAACYKLNTPESYERARQIVKDVTDANGVVSRRAQDFLVALAIQQNDPLSGLEVLSRTYSLYYTQVNLKVLALSKLNRPEDAFPILRTVLGREEQQRKTTLCSEVLEELKQSVGRVDDSNLRTELDQELEKIQKTLMQANRISNEKLEKFLLTPIAGKISESPQLSWDTALRGAAFNRNRRDKRKPRDEEDLDD